MTFTLNEIENHSRVWNKDKNLWESRLRGESGGKREVGKEEDWLRGKVGGNEVLRKGWILEILLFFFFFFTF